MSLGTFEGLESARDDLLAQIKQVRDWDDSEYDKCIDAIGGVKKCGPSVSFQESVRGLRTRCDQAVQDFCKIIELSYAPHRDIPDLLGETRAEVNRLKQTLDEIRTQMHRVMCPIWEGKAASTYREMAEVQRETLTELSDQYWTVSKLVQQAVLINQQIYWSAMNCCDSVKFELIKRCLPDRAASINDDFLSHSYSTFNYLERTSLVTGLLDWLNPVLEKTAAEHGFIQIYEQLSKDACQKRFGGNLLGPHGEWPGIAKGQVTAADLGNYQETPNLQAQPLQVPQVEVGAIRIRGNAIHFGKNQNESALAA